jgi:aromatic ring-opening dioxygenase catalytic subunit (LigB family)
LFYDYYGFPKAAYEIQYPAPGCPVLAKRMADQLIRQGICAQIDLQRGYDHGHFIPLRMMYPQADIPTTQLSLLRGLDPGAHIALGRGLRSLLSENILVIGSGFSFHNMSLFMSSGAGGSDPANDAFQDWLVETVTSPGSEEEREQRLVNWELAPSARHCHPREEHLLPLHVCQGMAGAAGEVIFDDQILGFRSLGFLW